MGTIIVNNDAIVMEVLRDAKNSAKRFRALTGRPLGITGEVAEYEAARILGLTLAPARQAGYDAVEQVDGGRRHPQIKGCCVPVNYGPGQRLGSRDIAKEWDAVLLVLLDEEFEAFETYEADRDPVVAALQAPGSKARNQRHALGVGKFKAIGRRRWVRSAG